MKNEKKTYEEVARLCSKYTPCKSGCCSKNSVSENEVSCRTCAHFTNSYCDLDLYDQIAVNHKL